MITERIDQELLDAAAELKVVATFGVGYDHIDVAACTKRGVAVCNTPGVLVETVADLTLGLILAAARRIPEAAEAVKQGRWGAWSPWFMLATDVHHQTLGIVGLGAIGQQVARRARGFDMRVLYTSRRRRPDLEQQLGVEHAPFDRLLRESDFVSLHVPLTPETRNLISGPQLEEMKETAFLINTTRGAVVDQDALHEACRAGRIGGAALDVTSPEPLPPDHPLLSLPNVVVTPHVGSATLQTRLKMGRMAAEGIAAVLTGRRPPAIVNPDVLG
jgi:glyoxylate reductase